MNHTQQAQEKIKDILGVEVSPDGEENFLLTRDEEGNILEGVDFTEEVEALTDLVAQTIKDTEERIVGEIENKVKEMDAEYSVFDDFAKDIINLIQS